MIQKISPEILSQFKHGELTKKDIVNLETLLDLSQKDGIEINLARDFRDLQKYNHSKDIYVRTTNLDSTKELIKKKYLEILKYDDFETFSTTPKGVFLNSLATAYFGHDQWYLKEIPKPKDEKRVWSHECFYNE